MEKKSIKTDQMRTCIYEEEPYQVFWEYEPTEEMFSLLEQTSWGTGKTVYQHFNNREHFLHIPQPNIFTVREAGKLRAFTVFVHRTFPGLPNQGKAFYIRFFCAAPEVKGHGVVKNMSEIVINEIRRREKQVCFYATIEANNPAVRKVITRIGFAPITTIKTLGFSRTFPKERLAVSPLTDTEKDHFLTQLDASKSAYQFWTKDNLFVSPGYFVHKEAGEILLGVQVHLAQWAIQSLPGLPGKLLPIIPYIPFLNRIFNPRAFNFLSFEGFYVKPGYEHLLTDFMETLLKRFKHHTAMFWLEARDPLVALFNQADMA